MELRSIKVHSGYFISDEGDVYHNGKKKNKYINPRNGYYRLMIQGKNYRLCQLVARRFVENPSNKPNINHKDGNKLNDKAGNLEWVTQQENIDHAISMGLENFKGINNPMGKYTKEDVEKMRSMKKLGFTQRRIAKEFGSTQGYISQVLSGKKQIYV